MLGGLLAGCDESPGDLVFVNGKQYKRYRGMASLGCDAVPRGPALVLQGPLLPGRPVRRRDRHRGHRGPGALPRAARARSRTSWSAGCTSRCSTSGRARIPELQARGKFVRITPAGLKESHPHDVQMIREAPELLQPVRFAEPDVDAVTRARSRRSRATVVVPAVPRPAHRPTSAEKGPGRPRHRRRHGGRGGPHRGAARRSRRACRWSVRRPSRPTATMLDASLTAPAVWVVDPLDGTQAFVEGVPEYAVMVALVVQGEPTCRAGSACRSGRDVRGPARRRAPSATARGWSALRRRPMWRGLRGRPRRRGRCRRTCGGARRTSAHGHDRARSGAGSATTRVAAGAWRTSSSTGAPGPGTTPGRRPRCARWAAVSPAARRHGLPARGRWAGPILVAQTFARWAAGGRRPTLRRALRPPPRSSGRC